MDGTYNPFIVITIDTLMNALYPEITPYSSGYLSVSDEHSIYYECCGNPNGLPVVFLHGGPGSGCNPNQRRFFNPALYKIVLFDQRGCGRSEPAGGTTSNTTQALVSDIEALREHLSIERWLVFGGSWGSTLAIAYALAHASKVMGLILRGIFLSRPSELDWFLGSVKQFFPEAWQSLISYLPSSEQDDVLAGYAKRVFSDDPKLSVEAATRWNAFEGSIMSLLPPTNTGSPTSPEVELARARVQIHYIQHGCFMEQERVFERLSLLSSIPTTIIQGRYDMVCPPVTAWELSQALPHAEFIVVPDAGHSAMEKGVVDALVGATDHFAQLNALHG